MSGGGFKEVKTIETLEERLTNLEKCVETLVYLYDDFKKLEERMKKLEDTPKMVMCINCEYYRNWGSDGEGCAYKDAYIFIKEGLHICKHYRRDK